MIYVFAADVTGCGSYRMIWPAQALIDAGHTDIKLRWPGKHWEIGAKINRAGEVVDVVAPEDATTIVIQRPAHAHMVGCIPHWKRLGLRVVVDVDDALGCIDPANAAFEGLRPKPGSLQNWNHLMTACQMADAVTVTTPALAAMYRRDAVVIPNYLPDTSFTAHLRVDSDEVCWPAAMPSHPNDATVLGPTLERVARETGCGVRMLGDGPLAEPVLMAAFGLSSPPRIQPYLSIEEYPVWLASVGIGVAPLADTKFNAAKCVDASTRISTRRGVILAAEIQEGDHVWRDGWRRVEAIERSVPAAGRRLTTEGGYELLLTMDHRMLVNGEWTAVRDITIGDAMHLSPEPTGPTQYVRIPWPADSRMSHKFGNDPTAFLTAPDGPTLEITPRWGRFLGAFAGDGSCGQSTQVTISCDGIDQDWIDLLMSDFVAMGFTPGTEIISTRGGQVLRRRSVRIASAHLLRVLASIGVTRDRENGRPIRVPCVPEVIWRSPENVRAEFLAGYFEADGTSRRGSVSATSKSEDLIRDVQRLLLGSGIQSNVTARVHRAQNGFSGTYWQVKLNRASTDVFAKEIRFRSLRKNARLDEDVSRKPSNAYRPMNWHPQVVSIEDVIVDPVDIQVEGSEYIAAGFVSHNSWLKPLEMMAAGVPFVASPRADYQALHDLTGVGLMARKPNDWYRQLRRVVTDPVLRKEQSEAGREAAEGFRIRDHAYLQYQVWKG